MVKKPSCQVREFVCWAYLEHGSRDSTAPPGISPGKWVGRADPSAPAAAATPVAAAAAIAATANAMRHSIHTSAGAPASARTPMLFHPA